MKIEALELIEACESNDSEFIENFISSNLCYFSESERRSVLEASHNLDFELLRMMQVWALFDPTCHNSLKCPGGNVSVALRNLFTQMNALASKTKR